MQKNTYGFFSEPGGGYCITTPDTPRNWYNYLWNDRYNACFSQVAAGEGFLQDDMGRRVTLVTGRQVYLLDAQNHQFWTANGLPLTQPNCSFQCMHRPGSSEIALTRHEISTRYSVFVPREGVCEYWTVEVENKSAQPRTIKVIPFASTDLDGPYQIQGYNTGVGKFLPSKNAVVLRSSGCLDSARERELYGYLMADHPVDGYDTRRNAFIGVYGTHLQPKALQTGGCTNSECLAEKLCFALQTTLTLQPGERVRLRYALGLVDSCGELDALEPFAQQDAEHEIVMARYASLCENVKIGSPNEAFNHLFNHWLKYQTLLGSRWARVRHNGYRDIVSDCDCLSCFSPETALERFKRILNYQYPNGYAPRTFRDGWICDNNFADCAVGIPMALYSIVMETGDRSILEQTAAFNDGSSARLYDHAKRAVDFLWNFKGLHGLLRIWGGDWNDCMNRAGLEGKGASVWLSMAWYRANQQFMELAELLGEHADAETARARAAQMRRTINKAGWDGSYYLCAYKDNGEKIGSQACREGQVFLIPQLWSILSGVVTKQKLPGVLTAIDKLLATKDGTLVSAPSYTHIDNTIGNIGAKPPGTHENGGIYLHTMAWKLAAEGMLGRCSNLYQTLQQMLPIDDEGAEKKCEPYVMCNSFFTNETGYRSGTPGQSWRSAAGAWLLKAVTNYLFGLQPTFAGLRLNPCIPQPWKDCWIQKTFRGTTYDIRYHGWGSRVAGLAADGRRLDSEILPVAPGRRVIIDVTMAQN